MSRRFSFALFALVLASTLLGVEGRGITAPSGGSDAARVSLVWIFGDDDALNPPDARTPPSPAAAIGDRPGYDALASGLRSRYTGRENRLELRLRGEAPGFLTGLTTRAELALGIDVSSLGEREGGALGAPIRAEDRGSFIEARLELAESAPFVVLRLFPIDGDLLRVGWTEALGWGGATGPMRESPYATASGPVRAGHLGFVLRGLQAFAGLKTASFVEPVSGAPAIEETSYGFFGGVEARPVELLLLGLAGGYFEHGVLESAGRGARAVTAGGSARLVVRRGIDEPRSPTAFLGPNDDPFRGTEDAPPGAFAFGGEVVALVQRLGDFDNPGSTALAPARALSLFGGARLGPFEVSGAFTLREPEFVMRNVPGVFADQTIPRAAERAVERMALVTNGVVLSELFRLDLTLALRFPAAVMLGALDRLGQPTGATLVLNAPGDVALLPPGSVPVPVFELRPAFELRLSRLLSAVGWLGYRRDYNRTRLVAEAGNLVAKGFADPDRFGYGVAARATW